MLVCLLHASHESLMATLEVNFYMSIQKAKLAAQNVIIFRKEVLNINTDMDEIQIHTCFINH